MEIQRWRDHPAVRRALAELADYRPALEMALAIQQVPAPTFAEAARSALVLERLRELGLSDVTSDELGNVYGRRPGRSDRPALLVAAHLDTVFPIETDLQVRHEGDRIYGAGIFNMKGGVASMVIAALAAKHNVAASRIAYGVPVGGELEFIDSGTLSRALSGRRQIQASPEEAEL